MKHIWYLGIIYGILNGLFLTEAFTSSRVGHFINFKGFFVETSRIVDDDPYGGNEDPNEVKNSLKKELEGNRALVKKIFDHYVNESHPYKNSVKWVDQRTVPMKTQLKTQPIELINNISFRIYTKKGAPEGASKKIERDFLLCQFFQNSPIYNIYKKRRQEFINHPQYKVDPKQIKFTIEDFDSNADINKLGGLFIHQDTLRKIDSGKLSLPKEFTPYLKGQKAPPKEKLEASHLGNMARLRAYLAYVEAKPFPDSVFKTLESQSSREFGKLSMLLLDLVSDKNLPQTISQIKTSLKKAGHKDLREYIFSQMKTLDSI